MWVRGQLLGATDAQRDILRIATVVLNGEGPHCVCTGNSERSHLSDSTVKAICQLCKTSGLAARYVTANRKKMPAKKMPTEHNITYGSHGDLKYNTGWT